MDKNKSLAHHLIRSFQDAFRGLSFVWKEERNFRIQLCIALLVIAGGVWLRFDYIEMALLVFAILLVLTAEVTNTAFEDTMNKIEPNQDPLVGKVKDIAAGIAVLNALGAVAIGAIIFIHHFL